ncbi:hypothetical protein MPSEU_000128500 [Mayamaea pseudoterrestris]|nr:hypothetical protein MPSEU_000128500 [Mayamaea pseudoterrestris]
MISPNMKRRSPSKSVSPTKQQHGRKPLLMNQPFTFVHRGYILLFLLMAAYAIMLSIHSETVQHDLEAVSAAFLPSKDRSPIIATLRRREQRAQQNELLAFENTSQLHPSVGHEFLFRDELTTPRNWNFPRWDSQGIQFSALQTFIEAMPTNATTLPWPRIYHQFPELLYVLNARGLHVSTTKRSIITKANQRYRVYPTEEAMRLAHHTLRRDKMNQWPRLRQALKDGGFPFLVWNGDFLSCNRNNFHNLSVPLFTVCGSLSCNYSFPLPTYKTILDSKFTPKEWETSFQEYERNFTMDEKLPKIVWRGSLTGALKNYKSDRARIARFPVDHPSDLLDIGLSSIPERHSRGRETVNISYFGGLAKSIKPQERFMRYMGILDIDGNSWSSRFGKLLCYNSVIVKVEPRYVDYFYKSLQPWVHFVPVKHDLSDLLAKAAFVTDPSNREMMRSIVVNANKWCSQHMIYSTIARDILDIWEEYVYLLDVGDPNWVETWKQWKHSLMKSPDFKMDPLYGRYRIIKKQKL